MRPLRPAASREARNRISVLVADGHGVMRDGLRHILGAQQDINVVAAVSDGAASLRETERFLPQVALLGMVMDRMTGIEATRAILAAVPGVAVVLVAARASPLTFDSALEAGALACLTRENTALDVLKAVRAAAAGRRYPGTALAERRAAAQGADPSLDSITATERKILKLVADGRSNAAVAEMLGLSPRTVETYRLRMMRKLQVDDLPALVKFAIRHGITPLDC